MYIVQANILLSFSLFVFQYSSKLYLFCYLLKQTLYILVVIALYKQTIYLVPAQASSYKV